MAFDLDVKAQTVKVEDTRTGDTYSFEVLVPTTEQRLAYRTSGLAVKKGKLTSKVSETQLRMAPKLIIGVAAPVADGLGGLKDGFILGGKPLQSDPAHADYRPDWLARIIERRADIIMQVVASQFDGVATVSDDSEAGDNDDDEAAKGEPGPLA